MNAASGGIFTRVKLANRRGWQKSVAAGDGRPHSNGETEAMETLEAQGEPIVSASPVQPPPAALRRVDDDGNAVPGSQDSALAERLGRALNLDELSLRMRRTKPVLGFQNVPAGGDSVRKALYGGGKACGVACVLLQMPMKLKIVGL